MKSALSSNPGLTIFLVFAFGAMIVRVFATKLTVSLVVAMHPVAVLSKARHPDEFVSGVPVGGAVVVGAISDVD